MFFLDSILTSYFFNTLFYFFFLSFFVNAQHRVKSTDAYTSSEHSDQLYSYLFSLFLFCSRLIIVVVLLFYVHGKHLRSCRDGQLT